jgi:hypothetical protein
MSILPELPSVGKLWEMTHPEEAAKERAANRRRMQRTLRRIEAGVKLIAPASIHKDTTAEKLDKIFVD